MPWEQTSAMDQRVQFIADWLSDDYTKMDLCRAYGISRPTADKWIQRYQQGGVEQLEERSRAAHCHSNQTSEEIRQMLIDTKLYRQSWGPKKVLDYLRDNGPELVWPADSTAGEILKRVGLVKRRVRHHHVSPYSEPFGDCQGPNQIWSADFKGDFALGNHRRCYPLTLSDNFSRYLLLCRALEHPSYAAVRPWFEWAFREYGLPQAIRTDNGAPFASLAIGGVSRIRRAIAGSDLPARSGTGPARVEQRARRALGQRVIGIEVAAILDGPAEGPVGALEAHRERRGGIDGAHRNQPERPGPRPSGPKRSLPRLGPHATAGHAKRDRAARDRLRRALERRGRRVPVERLRHALREQQRAQHRQRDQPGREEPRGDRRRPAPHQRRRRRLSVRAGDRDREEAGVLYEDMNDSRGVALLTFSQDAAFFLDAVRPLVTPRIVGDCFRALDDYDAVDVAIPSADTIIEVGPDDNTIRAIPPRANLRRGQTPQAFRRDVLRAIRDVVNKEIEALRATGPGDKAEFHFRLSQLRILAGQSHGASHGNLAPATQRVAVDRRDRRLGHGLRRAQRPRRATVRCRGSRRSRCPGRRRPGCRAAPPE